MNAVLGRQRNVAAGCRLCPDAGACSRRGLRGVHPASIVASFMQAQPAYLEGIEVRMAACGRGTGLAVAALGFAVAMLIGVPGWSLRQMARSALCCSCRAARLSFVP